MSTVRFRYHDVAPLGVKKKRELKSFIASIFFTEKKLLKELNFIFCSDSFLLGINQTFLDHDYFTDIITFDLSSGNGVVGEIYISLDRVKENAAVHKCSLEEEALRVIFHGVLHLVGYNDKKKSEITVMRHKEEYYLRLFKA